MIIQTLYLAITVPISVLLTVSGTSALINYFITEQYRKRPPPPGKQKSIESVKAQVYYNLVKPVFERDILIVFESGNTLNSACWYHIQRKLKDLGIASISYDRIGYGFSYFLEKGRKRTPKILAAELKELLVSLGIEQRIMIVGHAFGCAVVNELQQIHNVECSIMADCIDKDTIHATPDYNNKQRATKFWFIVIEWLMLSGFVRTLTWMPYFWKVMLQSSQLQTGNISMTNKETELYSKDTDLILKHLLSSSSWYYARKELDDMNDDDYERKKSNKPVHFYIAGLNNNDDEYNSGKASHLKRQYDASNCFNMDTNKAEFYTSEEEQLDIPYSNKFFEFILQIYEYTEAKIK